MSMDELAIVRALGVRVHEVDGLAEPALYVDENATLFVRAGLGIEKHRQICDDVLAWIEPAAGAVA